MIRPRAPVLVVVSLLGAFLAIAGCDSLMPAAPEATEVLAGPLEGLNGAQMSSHLAGDEAFARVFSPAEGLGPLFVAPSCESCHVGDGKGHQATTLIRFGRLVGGIFDPMSSRGGPQLQHRAVAGYVAETVPLEATGLTQLMAPAVTGLGFLEAVTDQTLLELSDPQDADGDGISGRPNWIDLPDWVRRGESDRTNRGRYIGRFGKKASARDLNHQTANAYAQDMGLTTAVLPTDLHNPDLGPDTGNLAADPEIQSDEFQSVVFYIRTLKAPPRRNTAEPEVLAGERLFSAVGCDGCHAPRLTTGPSPITDLDRVEFAPYTDMLLHDMGQGLDDGYTEGTALTSEWRTPPLWGIGLAADSQGGSPRYLHDGRASTLEDAILFHGGEGEASREAFSRLSASEKASVVAFLESL